jgi:hypothetical protein
VRGVLVAALLLLTGTPLVAAADGRSEDAAQVRLPPTLITEGATPATDAEVTFTLAKSAAERNYGIGVSSLQYAPIPAFGIKLAVPARVRESRAHEPTVGGIGDVSVMAKYAPLMLGERQLAVSGGIKLTLPTGSEKRDLGGELAVTPFLAAGKGLGAFSLQADAGYTWQLDQPRAIEADEEGAPPLRPDRAEQVTANLTGTYSPHSRLSLILELNSVTVVSSDETLNERVQLYVTPGLSVDLAAGWNLRAGIQLPVTSAQAFDYNLVVILTRGF